MTWIPEYLVLVGMERMRHILKEINSSNGSTILDLYTKFNFTKKKDQKDLAREIKELYRAGELQKSGDRYFITDKGKTVLQILKRGESLSGPKGI